MLKVDISNTGFSVIPESDERYELKYGFFALGDDVNAIPAELHETGYWDSYECFEQKVNEQECFIYVVEKDGSRVVDERRFYFSSTGRKSIVSWSINKLPWYRRFEEDAHEIVLTWQGAPERVKSEYIYLYRNGEPNDKYQFLTDEIKPVEDKNGEYTDCYIFFPEDGTSGSDYKIGFEPLFLEKYRVVERKL